MATDYGRKPDSIGQPESMRNEEQKLRDNQGGSELTDLPDDHPVGAPGETASAEAEGPPPRPNEPFDETRGAGRAPSERADDTRAEGPLHPGDNDDIGAPVRSLGPIETTLPEESPLTGEFQPGPPEQGQPRSATRDEVSRAEQKLRDARVEHGRVVPEEERDE